MTIKELFKKIENYNEVAKMVGTKGLYLHVTIGYTNDRFDTFKVFRKRLRDTYIDEVAEAILKNDSFALGEDVEINTVGRFGDELNVTVCVEAYEKW